MALLEDISLIEYDDEYARDAVAMWRVSKEKALGVRDVHFFDDQARFPGDGRPFKGVEPETGRPVGC